MDSLFHAHTKLLADAATANTTSRPESDSSDTNGPPPAYATVNVVPGSDFDHGHSINPNASDTTDLDGEEDETTEPQCLDIDASTTIHGSQNIIAVQPVDGTRLTAILISLLQGQANTQAYVQQQQQLQPPPSLSALLHGRKTNVRIDCGVRIVGDRNVLGGPGIIKPKTNGASSGTDATTAGPHIPTTTIPTTTTSEAATAPCQHLETQTTVGIKRKADDDVSREPELKKTDVKAGANSED